MDTEFFAFPTSFTQQRLWFLDQLQPNTATYNVTKLVTLPGAPHASALSAALGELVRRHDTLRTTLPAVDGHPYQLIASHAQLPFRKVDLRRQGARRQWEEIARLAREDAAVPFDLGAGPLVRATVAELEDTAIVVVTMHHAITDGTSMELLAEELRVLYEACRDGTPAPLPELPLQYGDYAVWQRSWLESDEAREQLAYWRAKLAGAPQVLELPWDRPRPAEQGRDGATQEIVLPAGLSHAISAFSRAERVTTFMTLLAAFQILVARLSALRDVVVGTPIAGRSRTELERLIGFFVNTLVLRTDLSGNPTLREIVHRAEATAMDAYARQDLPFDRIVAELAPDRTLAHSPLVQVLFALQNVGSTAAREVREDPGFGDEAIGAEEAAEDELDAALDPPVLGLKFDLIWTLVETEEGISGQIEYSTALLDASTVRRWAGLYKRILTALVRNPDTRLEELQLLSSAERARAIEAWNATDAPFPRDAALPALFAQQVSRQPDAPAVIYGDRELTYAQLDGLSSRIARWLRSSGIGPGDRVGICVPNSPELVAAMLAVLKCGAAYVPLDPHHPPERIRAIMADAAVRMVLTPELLRDPPDAVSAPSLPQAGGGDVAYVMYTSGSTGAPKGVCVPHRAITRLVINTNYVTITPGDRVAQASNAAFDAATFEIWGALLNGAALVGIDRDTALSPRRYAEALRSRGVTVLFVTTALFNQVAREVPDAFATVRQVMFGGEATDPRAVRAVLEAGRPGRLQNVYGPTETTTFAAFHDIDTVEEDEAVIPIGRPIANTQVYVLDAAMEPQPPGVPGELFIGGDGLATEYHGAPALTAERFVDDPFRPGGRLYRTGDIARYRADGAIEFVGRRDLQTKVRGFRVELGEVEAVLASHEAIRDAAVAAYANGGGPVQLLGYVVWRNGHRPSVTGLRAWMGERLPDYMIPAQWIELDALPLNTNGKVDRRALPAPTGDRPQLDVAYAEPATAAEREVARTWSQLLGIDKIGRHDNFFALGGHSLLATQAVARLRDRLGTDIPVRVVFERPTVAAFAEWIAERQMALDGRAARAIGRRTTSGPAPLSFSQQRLWFLDQLEPGLTLYNIQTVLYLDGDLEPRVLERSVTEAVRRHESLRTRFAVADGVPVQVIDPPGPFPLPFADLSHVPRRAAEREYAARVADDLRTPFDLQRGPLFRARVLTVGPGDHRLVMTMHHVISDGWSLGVLHKELEELYGAGKGGRAPALPGLPIQYSDFAVWQRQRMQGEELSQLIAWWRAHLDGAPHVINLPTDRPRPAEQSFDGETQTKVLAPGIHTALEAIGQREGATLFITLLTAWYILLHRFSGEDDIVVGTPIANRTRSEVEPLIGFFVNTLVIRTAIQGNPSFRELLRQVRDAANGAYAHQDLPFERLVAELAPERRLSHSPLFQCFFALQNESSGVRGMPVHEEDIDVQPALSMFDLSLTMVEAGGRLAASFEYPAELFDRETITRLVGQLERLLEGIASDPDRPIFAYPLMSDEERQEVLAAFNATAAAYPPVPTVLELFEERVRVQPEAVAVKAEEGELTYAALRGAAEALAARLWKAGVGQGTYVALMLPRSLDLLRAIFGILRAGAAYVPLDPKYPRARLSQILADARVSAVVTCTELAPLLPDCGAPVLLMDAEPELARADGEQLPPGPRSGDAAYVIYTSGSTGQPKGVPILHRSLLNYTEAACEVYGIHGGDRVLQFGSISFDTIIEEIFPVLTRGGTLVLRTQLMSSSIEELFARCGEWRVSVITLPTAFWHEMVSRMVADHLELPASVRVVIVGGDRALPGRVAEWMEYVGGRVGLINGYGPTESTVVATVHTVSPEDGQRPEVPIGRPIRNTRVYVLDAHQQPVPIGVRGELWIAGDSLSPGYLNKPELTAERFRPDPFASTPDARMYRSGDLARWLPGGVLEFRGRADRQVKVRGFRIELAEIEAVLHQHEAVKESVVLTHEDERGHKHLVAYVVPDPRYARHHTPAEPRQIEAWQGVFDDLYAELDPDQRGTFYIKGWDSSYSGAPIPAAEVEEWMQQTVERILALNPRRVREIGCGGSGLLMFRVAPRCESYVATDLSANAVRVLQAQLDTLPEPLPGVQVLQMPAHRQALEPRSVDTVIMASVAQYFPSVEYLVEVLERTVDGVRDGGCIFVGDIRNHALLDAFHASVQEARAPESTRLEELRASVRKHVAAEKQLTVDPGFFHALARHIPRITGVEVRLLRGRAHNELTCFRYDVVLRVGGPAERAPVQWRQWDDGADDAASVRAVLAGCPDTPAGWQGVPNARVARAVAAARMLASDGGEATVAELRRRCGGAVERAIDPEALWSLAAELGWTAEISWPALAGDGRFDVVFVPPGTSLPVAARHTDAMPRSWPEYANAPTRRSEIRNLVSELRTHASERLPGYMVPASIVVLDALPMTPTGKLDRKALPLPERGRDTEAGEERPLSDVERILAAIWADVLDVPSVSPTDNFFQLGGDSILSIQVIARANEAGLRLTPKQLFQHQTVAELASVAGAARPVHAGEASGVVPLTPIQHWFFSADIRQMHAFTQSAIFELDGACSLETAEAILEQLQRAHDAFRLRYARETGGWRQFYTETSARIPVTVVDMSGMEASDAGGEVERVAAALQQELNITTGPIARAALITARGEQARLLLVAHHLIVDGVSWRILHQDVRALFEQSRAGQPLLLPPRTTSFQHWAQRLVEYAKSNEAARALEFWKARLQGAQPALPLDVYAPDAEAAPDTVRQVTLTFSAEETRALLQDVPRAYRTQINDVLLAALAQALTAWTGRRSVVLDIEGHGREPIFEDVDLSRSVGWFTSVFPMVLELGEASTPGDVLRAVKEQLRQVPAKGLPYGILRYLPADPAAAELLRALPQPRVCFNYLGQFGTVRLARNEPPAGDTPADGIVLETSKGEWGAASHLLDINGGVEDGRLWVTWAFSTRFHLPQTIESVVRRFATELRRLILHCASDGTRGYSPSDFPLAGLGQEKLEWLLGADREVADLYPLSPMQAGMLFHALYDPDSAEYLEQSLSELPAELDVSAYRRAWELLVERHTILRTCFLWSGLDAPLQMVRQRVELPWQVHDWSQLDPEAAETALERYLEEDRGRGFDLSRAPLLRFALFRNPGGTWWFLWTSHHISLDGWSQARLRAELQALYDAVLHGRDAALEPVRPFRHYIEWLRQQELSRAEAFWKEALRGFTTPTQLPICEAAGADDEEKEYLEQQIGITAADSAAIEELARHCAVTANTVAQGAWALLLSRYASEEEVLFGATVSGRPVDLPGVERMVGLFINTLPVRVQVDKAATVGLWLKRLQRQQVEARQFEHASLVDIQAWSEVPRGEPLFNTLLVFENYPDLVVQEAQEPDEPADGADLEAGAPAVPLERTNYPLTVAVIPGRRWSIRATYDAGRFTGDAIARLLGHYRTLLAGLARDAAAQVGAVPLLTRQERDELLSAWSGTAPAASPMPVHRYFERQAALTPGAPAVDAGGVLVTYGELNARAERLASLIGTLREGPPRPVGICVERSVDLTVAVLAALKAGGGYVPLDAAYPAERLRFMLEDAEVSVLLTHDALASRFAGFSGVIVRLDAGEPRALLADSVTHAAQPGDPAYIIYTSGSTGRPKGVVMPHGPLANLIEWHLTAGTPRRGARTLQFAPLSFDVHFQELFSTWAAGGTVVLVPEDTRRDPHALLRYLAERRVDRLFLPFVALQSLAEAAEAGAAPPLCEVITAGEQLQCSPAIRALFRALPAAVLHNHYGPSETHVVTAHALSGDPDMWPALPPIGRPIHGARVYVLDDRMRPVPAGVPGELFIGGPVLALGYMNRPDLTASRFVQDPFSGEAGGRLYRTGDLARFLEDGEIEFLGRTDFQVKIRGFRIEPGEVEVVLAAHPAVQQAVVTAVEHAPGDRRLVAYVVPQHPPGPPAAELRSFAAARLPEYMVPATIVSLPSLPLTPSGKVDRKALPDPEWAGQDDARERVAPRDPVEERLAAIYADVLRLDAIGIDENFFDLGGHSLLATRIVSRIRDAFHVELPLRAVFEAPTVASIAGLVVSARAASLRDQKIPRRREAGTCQLSYAQQRLWFLDQLHPNTPMYNVTRAVALDAGIAREHVEAALNEIVRRHEALRTTFTSIEGRPFQFIAATLHVEVPEYDLRRYGRARRDREYARVQAEVFDTPFDLARGPLLRAASIRLSASRRVLLIAMHHIVTDGWSMEILGRELEQLASAFASGQPPNLPELRIQYADYAVWQRQRLDGEDAAVELAQCRKRLAGLPSSLELPWDHPRPSSPAFDGATMYFDVPQALASRLREYSRSSGVTLFTTLLTGFKALLSRLSRSHDIVVGTPASGRSHTETEDVIGFFVNTLVLRTDLSGNPSLGDSLRRVHRAVLDAFDSQDVPFDRLVAELAPDRQGTHHPLVQVMFALQEAEGAAGAAAPVADGAVEPGTAKFDVTLTMADSGQSLSGAFEFATALLDADTVRRWFDYYLRVLTAIVDSPGERLDDVRLLTPAERHRAIVEWNDTAAEYPRDASLGALFEEQATARPDALAVSYGASSLTYRQLDERSARLAGLLREKGVREGDRVAVLMQPSTDWIAALVGIVRIGAAYVPIDPSHPEARQRTIMRDAGAAHVVTDDTFSELPSRGDAAAAGSPDAIAYVMYTSGSTGTPKGVAIPQRAVTRLVRNTNYVALSPADRLAQASHPAFDAATFEIWGALLNGAAIVGIGRETLLTPARYAAALQERGVSITFVTTALFNQIAREQPSAFATVRCVLFGGESADIHAVRAVLAAGAPRRLMNVYGPTESTTFATFFDTARLSPEDTSVPIGGPIANTAVYVLDGHLEPQLTGVPGEIYIGGDGLAAAYLGAPELTAERFLPNPFGPGRLYRTGDLGRYRADGAIEFVGRRDQQVKVRGFRVEPGEIEAALRQHPSLQAAVVQPHAAPGGVLALAAYVVSRPGPAVPVGDLRAWLEQRVPSYMIPSWWMELPELPLNANGKIDRHALPAPGSERPELASAYTAPSTSLQAALAAIWRDLLRKETVGIHDNFFELGGHSLLAIQVVARVREALGIELPVRFLFEQPTIAALAEKLGDGATSDPAASRIRRRPSSASAPLSFSQERLWFLNQIEDAPLFNIHHVAEFRGGFARAALENALTEIVRRHEILRTSIVEADGVATQIIAPPFQVRLPVVDLSGLARREREVELSRRSARDVEEPFILSRAPLFRATLVRMSRSDHRLLLTLHHIAADGWSLAVLQRELDALYSAFKDGRPSPLSELPVQYADFAVWQRSRIAGPALQPQLEYWRRQLASPPRVLELPRDKPRPAQESSEGARQSLLLPGRLGAAVRQHCQAAQSTPFMFLLAALDVVLHRYSGQTDLLVGCPVAGRSHAEIEPLIGFFLNTLPLRVNASDDPAFAELLERVRRTSLDAFANQDVPYERILEELPPDRAGRAPLFRIYFNVISFETAGLEAGEGAQPGDAGRVSPPERTRSIFDLTLYVFEHQDTFRLDAVYRTDLYESRTIERFLLHLQGVIDAATANPGIRLSQFVLPAGEVTSSAPSSLRSRRYREFLPEETEQSIGARFEQQAERFAKRLAVRTRRHTWTYSELQRFARGVASRLQQQVKRGERVGLLCAHDAPMLAGLFGTLLAGGVYVPLDPAHPRERHLAVLTDSDAVCVLADLAHAAAAAELGLPVITIEDAGTSAGPLVPAEDPGALAYILYTSGSTGRPKGVVQNHRNVLHHCRVYTNALRFAPGDRITLLASYGFDAAVMDIFGALLNGAALYPIDLKAETPETVAAWMAGERVTVLHSTPTVLRHLLAADAPSRFSSIRAVVLGGEEALPRDLELYRTRFPRRSVLVNGLGPTECTLALQCLFTHEATVPRNTLPVGFAVDGTEVLLLNAEGKPIPGCGVGEIAYRSRHIARGYWKLPELTARAFQAGPDDPAIITYRTGDIGHRLPDGRMEFGGRRDLQVKIRGVRIELGEIESRLAAYPGVQDAAVHVQESDEGEKRLVASVVTRGGLHVDPVELAAYLRTVLPEAMIPSRFVLLDALPLTPNGKLDRHALERMSAKGASEAVREHIPPSTPVERTLADIWAALLRVPRVSTTANFFELGGHSLLVTQLAFRVRGALGVDLPLRQYFAAPTLSALAAAIDAAVRSNGFPRLPSIPRARRDLFRVRVSHAGELVLPAALRAQLGDPSPAARGDSSVPAAQRAPFATGPAVASTLGAAL